MKVKINGFMSLKIKGKKADLNCLCAEIFALNHYIQSGESTALKLLHKDEYPLRDLLQIANDIYAQLDAVGYYSECQTDGKSQTNNVRQTDGKTED